MCCGYTDEDNLFMSQVERTPEAARQIAETWKQTAIERIHRSERRRDGQPERVRDGTGRA